MKTFLNWLLAAFCRIYEMFLYSLILPLTLGVIWILGGLYVWFMDCSWTIKIPASVAVGVCLNIWRDAKNKKDKERET